MDYHKYGIRLEPKYQKFIETMKDRYQWTAAKILEKIITKAIDQGGENALHDAKAKDKRKTL